MADTRARCGTVSGYQMHRNRSEDACEPCKKASADYNRTRRAKQRPKAPTASPTATPAEYTTASVEEHETAITELSATLKLLNEAIEADAIAGARNLAQLAKVKKEYLTEITKRKAAIEAILKEPEESEAEDDKPTYSLTITPN